MVKKNLIAIALFVCTCGKLTAQTELNSTKYKTSLGFIEGIKMMMPSSLQALAQAKRDSATANAASSITANMKVGLKQTIDMALETFLPFQFKYAILLNESVEKVTNIVLYKTIDDWYGTHYRYGGSTHKGIDCSAFMQVLGSYAFGLMLPRTAREQYAAMTKIEKEDLKEGDFVFFNTRGGVSHVGMYLQNNKFVHSSSSQGVSIGDLGNTYWSRRFLGARRAKHALETNSFNFKFDGF